MTESAVGGRRQRVTLPSALSDPLPVEVWSPHGLRGRAAAPMLWCFDGSSYARTGQLLQWAGAAIAAGRLPAFRIVLVDARRRMQWFSGSERFLRSVDLGVAALHERYAVTGPLAMLGSSLGGLTAMLVAMRRSNVGVVVSQSGSFFNASSREGAWPWLTRVRRLVRAIRDDEPIWGRQRGDHGVLIGMTCGRHEGNFAANEELATALRWRGYDVTFEPGRDLHNMVAWRDQLEPMLPNLLQRAWSATG
nr:alpha/beta hydrolase-fold protein [Flexivirga meconopsidis]